MGLDYVEERCYFFSEWQRMPMTFVALSWADESFKQEFLQTPTSFMQRALEECPPHVVYCVLENTGSMRHLVLPYRDPETFGWDSVRLTAQLQEETMYNDDLSRGLPVRVMVEAFLSSEVMRRLLVDPRGLLVDMGYDVGDYTYFVHQNTPATCHLVLPLQQAEAFLPYDGERELLISDVASELVM